MAKAAVKQSLQARAKEKGQHGAARRVTDVGPMLRGQQEHVFVVASLATASRIAGAAKATARKEEQRKAKARVGRISAKEANNKEEVLAMAGRKEKASMFRSPKAALVRRRLARAIKEQEKP